MRKHRFFSPQELQVAQTVELDQDLSHQIIKVLRMQTGDQIFIFNNSGAEYTAVIENIGRKTASVIINAVANSSLESPCKINLGQVLGKGEKMDLVVQKATELGVHSITPLFSDHAVVKNIPDRMQNKQEHWQKIANAACCQCGRNIVPTIHSAQNLNTWIKNSNDDLKIILSPSTSAEKLRILKLQSPISVLIGPEGGFSETEITHAQQHNFKLISLGPRVLRTETAGLAVIAILQSMLGDI